MKKRTYLHIAFLILLCSCGNNKQAENIRNLSEFIKNEANLDIDKYNSILIINDKGCYPCNEKLNLLNNGQLERSKNIIIYCDKTGYFVRNNTPINCIYTSKNIAYNFFNKEESVILVKEDSKFKYTSIFPRNLDSVINNFYK